MLLSRPESSQANITSCRTAECFGVFAVLGEAQTSLKANDSEKFCFEFDVNLSICLSVCKNKKKGNKACSPDLKDFAIKL